MKDLVTVMKFTIKEMINRKSFIISTIIICLIIILGFNVPNLLKMMSKDSKGDTLLIVDTQNIYEGNLEVLKQADLSYNIETSNENITFENIKEKIENEEIGEAIIIEKGDNNQIKLRYIVENMAMVSEVPQDIVSALNGIYANVQVAKLGLTPEQIQTLNPNFEFAIEQTEEQEVKGNVFAIMLLSIVLFYAIYFCAYQVSSSITTEKTSKIMETLVTSTTPKTIVLGKTIGIGIVGLLQVILFVAVALISAKSFLEPEMIDSVLDMSKITPYLGIVTVVYFILGYFAYALLYALTGSTVSKPEDIQSANGPVAILAVIGFYLSYFTMMNPTSELNVIASMLPISSPFCMPFRVMMGIASTTDVLISVAILIVTILVIAKVAITIYSNAILNYGTKMNFKDMVKMFKKIK